jgi:hypothetical protein
MKRIVLVFLFLNVMQSKAQDAQLFGHTWYLQQIVVADQTYPYPFQGYNSIIEFTNENFTIDFLGCYGTQLFQIAYSNQDGFTLPVFIGGFDFECGGVNPAVYELHYDFYGSIGSTNQGPFTYVVSTENGHDFLVVTNVNGDQAFYADAQLGTTNFGPSQFAVFYNTQNGNLEFSGTDAEKISRMTIYNQTGQAVFSASPIQNGANLSTLSSGMYFARISLYDGRTVVQKFLKY